jgi:F-type H+-transporting ATPase subunit gamma
VIKASKRLIEEKYAGKEVKVLSIGKKASDIFRKGKEHYTKGFGDTVYDIYDNMSFDGVADIANTIMTQFAEGQFDEVVLVYNQFKNAAVQKLQTEQFLPVVAPESEESVKGEYIFEPDKETIVKEMIPRSLKVQLYKAILDSVAAEHGARMTAMHKATDNASELKKDLKLFYNKARQAAITNEILEIVGGAEALNG